MASAGSGGPVEPPPEEERGQASLEHAAKVQSGLKWTTLSMVFFRFARLGTTVVLARLLTKADFGLVTMAMAFILAFQALRDIGFGPAFVQRKGASKEEEALFASTMFWVVLGINALMFAVGWAVAPHAAAYFPELPGLAPILRGVFGLLLIEAISTTPTAILQKQLAFGLIARGEMLGILLHAVLSIAFALLGFGAWSIIIGTLGSRLAQTLYVTHLARWRPSLAFDRVAAGQLFGFGRYLWGNSLLGASQKIVDKMVVGKLYDGAVLGLYGNAYNLCTTASKPIYSIILRVTFPALSRIQDDIPAIRRSVVTAVANVALVTVPLSVGLALTAEDFVVTLYSAKWREMAPLVEVLAFYGIVMSLASITAPVLMAIGRVKQMFLFALGGQLLMIGLFVALRGYEEMGIAMGLVSAAVLSETAAFVYMARRIALPLREVAGPLIGVTAAAVLMAVVVEAVQLALPDLASWTRLAVSVAAGAAAYALGQFLLNRRRFLESVSGLKSVIGAKGQAA